MSQFLKKPTYFHVTTKIVVLHMGKLGSDYKEIWVIHVLVLNNINIKFGLFQKIFNQYNLKTLTIVFKEEYL